MESHHERESELLVGFRKRATGLPSMTWPESVDVALCFGWIDGVRRRIDDGSYSIRFTPRRKRSIWSRVNIRRTQELQEQGRMRARGIEAFHSRDESKTEKYSYERERADLPEDLELRFREQIEAWEFFQSQPPSYRRPAIWWVISAKREETRVRRLAALIQVSAKRMRLDALSPRARGSAEGVGSDVKEPSGE